MRPSDNLNKLTTNWSNQGKRYDGPVKDVSKDIPIAYTGSNGKGEQVLVPEYRVQSKFQSLLEKGLNPKILP